ncbi:hypothetical protein [Henriciella sp.]|uniref:hypothetical protein n=1 Tax=Henriciella sp. TaxID=1968823 RepID=UPI0026306871|nr:hypothetical protein [Henriciella sp.]
MTKNATATGLFILRATLAIFFLVWALEKFIKPDTTAAIWEAFYFVEDLPAVMSYAVGVIQIGALVAFALGAFKFWSYGFFLVIHGLGTLTTWQTLINPYEGSNHLFIAAIPVLGALIALFLMRKQDTLLSIGK